MQRQRSPKIGFREIFGDVRFSTFATISANNGLMHRSNCVLFNHLIRTAEQRQRNGETQRFGGLQINDHLKLCGLLNWQICRLLTAENEAGVVRWSRFLRQAAKVDLQTQRMIHHEDTQTVHG